MGAVTGLVDEQRVLWGFAMRGYGSGTAPLPQLVLWEPARRAGYPGYGWSFPGDDGEVNVGLGVGVTGDRRGGARAARDLDAFVASHRPGAERAASAGSGGG